MLYASKPKTPLTVYLSPQNVFFPHTKKTTSHNPKIEFYKEFISGNRILLFINRVSNRIVIVVAGASVVLTTKVLVI